MQVLGKREKEANDPAPKSHSSKDRTELGTPFFFAVALLVWTKPRVAKKLLISVIGGHSQ